ncbi:recombinase family protein [Agrobacterium leguminum]|uniref:recombinase family protein n=1 Tax=Agrobacterium leguminum TaxID=2792015 RepID=UPI0022B80B5E|nr:recombinase family protein [Agrobacterium leguminum]MCZ7931067.1 recombinase family protein [Agrobacterium leguminum]
MTKYIAYYRVSTSKQGQSGLGLEAQKKAVETFTAGHTIVSEYVEVESGRKNDRPALKAAIADCKAKNATLLIAKLDRLARNVAFIANLMESGVDIQAVDNPTATKFSMHILSAVAELEATMISERTKAALTAAKDRGTVLGGFRWDKEAYIDHRKQVGQSSADMIFNWIKDIPDYESLTLQAIADSLNKNGYTTPRGKAFNPMQVKRAIERHTRDWMI